MRQTSATRLRCRAVCRAAVRSCNRKANRSPIDRLLHRQGRCIGQSADGVVSTVPRLRRVDAHSTGRLACGVAHLRQSARRGICRLSVFPAAVRRFLGGRLSERPLWSCLAFHLQSPRISEIAFANELAFENAVARRFASELVASPLCTAHSPIRRRRHA